MLAFLVKRTRFCKGEFNLHLPMIFFPNLFIYFIFVAFMVAIISFEEEEKRFRAPNSSSVLLQRQSLFFLMNRLINMPYEH